MLRRWHEPEAARERVEEAEHNEDVGRGTLTTPGRRSPPKGGVSSGGVAMHSWGLNYAGSRSDGRISADRKTRH